MPGSKWIPLGCSVKGASHRRRKKENQDAFLPFRGTVTVEGDHKIPSIMAVSDGHGGDKYMRSDVGAKMAVAQLTEIAGDNPNRQLSPRMRKDDLAGAVRHIKTRFLLLWQKAVDSHVEQTPFSEEELAFLKEHCSPKDDEAVRKNPRLAYGCTFMCAIAYDDLILLLQLGDGDILGLYADGTARELIPSDPRNIGNETLSLCSLHDVSDMAHEILMGSDIPELITLTTDGVKNSYDDQTSDIEAFYNIPVAMRNELHKHNGDIQMLKPSIDKWLEKVTTDGVGDDVTIGVLFREVEEF